MIGAIHWKVNMLIKLAPYSLETILSCGTGGFFERFSGFSRLYHGFFFAGSVVTGYGATEEVVVVVVNVLSTTCRPGLPFSFSFSFSFSGSVEEERSLSDPTYRNGSLAIGSEVFGAWAVPIGSVEAYSSCW